MATNEREELVAHLNRGRELLSILKDPPHRRTITIFVDYLERKLAAMDMPTTGGSGLVTYVSLVSGVKIVST